MSFHKQAVSTRYCVQVTRKSFPLNYDKREAGFYKDMCALAHDVEFDGMFGPYVWFSLNTEDNTLERHDQIRQVFKKYNVRVVS